MKAFPFITNKALWTKGGRRNRFGGYLRECEITHFFNILYFFYSLHNPRTGFGMGSKFHQFDRFCRIAIDHFQKINSRTQGTTDIDRLARG